MATPNWLVTCVCGSPTEYTCNTCGENLCGSCKDMHIQNNDTGHHSITEYANKLMPGSLSPPPCHEHNQKECVCWCKTCSKAACIDCVTKSHRGHEFTELETVLQEKRTSLQQELNNLESNVLKERQGLLKEARKATSNFLGQVNGIEKELDRRANEFHQRVEEIKENTKKQLNEFKTSNLAVLHEQEKRVSDGLEEVKLEIKDCEDRLRSSDMESLLKHEGTKKDTLPTVSYATPPVLTPSQIDTKALTEMFGQLNARKSNQGVETTQSTAASPDRPVQATHTDTQTRGATAPTKRLTQLIAKPSVQSEFDTGTTFPSVTCVGSGQAWIKTVNSKIQLVDRNGAAKDDIHTDFDFVNMVLSPYGDFLLCDNNKKCIKSISDDKTFKTLFKLKWIPHGLCCLHSGGIAVTFRDEGHVIIYSRSGMVIKELDKKLFSQPISLVQGKVNNNLYISDVTAGKVLALDKDYRVRFEYTGQGDTESFTPRGLCTDNNGRVLITDYCNHRVHILDKNGQFLLYLLTKEQGLREPYCIDMDNEGNAWVGEFYGCVKVVKYLQ